jgi:hypothetical protein
MFDLIFKIFANNSNLGFAPLGTALFVCIISHHPTISFFENKSASTPSSNPAQVCPDRGKTQVEHNNF